MNHLNYNQSYVSLIRISSESFAKNQEGRVDNKSPPSGGVSRGGLKESLACIHGDVKELCALRQF